jgi:hypothetical protein
MIRNTIESAGGRRFLLALLTNLITAVLVLADRVGDTVYASVIIATVGAYIAGNTAQKVWQESHPDWPHGPKGR